MSVSTLVTSLNPLPYQVSITVPLTIKTLLDGLNHPQPHSDCVTGMVWSGYGQPRHTVVTVSKDLDPHALFLLGILSLLDMFHIMIIPWLFGQNWQRDGSTWLRDGRQRVFPRVG
jgi:hypothetical protein